MSPPHGQADWVEDNRAAVVADLAPPSAAEVLDALLALYAAPGIWSRQCSGDLDLAAALWKVIGDEDDRRGGGPALVAGTFEAWVADLMTLDAARAGMMWWSQCCGSVGTV